MVLLFLLPFWAYGCQSRQDDKPRTVAVNKPKRPVVSRSSAARHFDNTALINAFYEREDLDFDQHPDVRRASDFIANPFLPASTPALKHYTQLLSCRYQIEKDTVTNLHNAKYIDTLYHLNFDSSTVELYYPIYTKQYLLSYADIKSTNLPLKNGIKVGMTRDELLQKLKDYKLIIKEQKNLIEVCDWERNTWLRFHFSKNRLSSIQYEGYID